MFGSRMLCLVTCFALLTGACPGVPCADDSAVLGQTAGTVVVGGTDFFWCALAQVGKYFFVGSLPAFVAMTIVGAVICGNGL